MVRWSSAKRTISQRSEETVSDLSFLDNRIGTKIRYRRWFLGMSQGELAKYIGVTSQQVQKYETGINRVSASRLWVISLALNVDPSFFFSSQNKTSSCDRRAAGS